MSVKVMGMVWDLKVERDMKFLLLAYADHAAHDGTNVYPSVALISEKTGYSERAVQLITRRLEFEGYLIEDGNGPHGTNKWYIPIYGGSIVPIPRGAKIAPVQKTAEGGAKTAEGGAKTAPEGVQPIAPESSLTVNEPSINLPPNSDVSWMLSGGVSPEDVQKMLKDEQAAKVVCDLFEQAMAYNPLPWDSNDKFRRLKRHLLTKTEEEIKTFARWSRRPFSAASPSKIRCNPQLAIDLWPQAFVDQPDVSKRPETMAMLDRKLKAAQEEEARLGN